MPDTGIEPVNFQTQAETRYKILIVLTRPALGVRVYGSWTNEIPFIFKILEIVHVLSHKNSVDVDIAPALGQINHHEM